MTNPEIIWTNCADEMPPDDDSLIIVKLSYINPDIQYVCYGRFCDYVAITSSAFLNEIGRHKKVQSKHWTTYTQKKWEYLNEQHVN